MNAGKGIKTNSGIFDHCSDENTALVANLTPVGRYFSIGQEMQGCMRQLAGIMHMTVGMPTMLPLYTMRSCVRNWNNEYRAALNIRAGEFTCPLCRV